ncbi:hypothetical protein QN277_009494 [Acacia crassicarpa]|uniref:16 kDa subunit of oxygen evolving system of photosystem II n=1 Tax=Acacia crassicarpa TaxID=499986 RepID=A0AAE1M5I6_9FABA|nr:hypothetical protein QN277_009494 [Acacia crassicarpa]
MAQAMASSSMAGLRSSSQSFFEGSSRLNAASGNVRTASLGRHGLVVRAQQGQSEADTSRRAVLGLVAAGLATGSFVQAVLADAKTIKVGPPPPPSGGLPGTLNSDEPRDLLLPLKDRFFLQPLGPSEAAKRAKESAKEILNVKGLIDKKAWPYVQNDLRLRAEYLRYDLNTVISAKPKDEKKSLKELSGKLFQTISNLDHAAKIKSQPEAEKYYAETYQLICKPFHLIGLRAFGCTQIQIFRVRFCISFAILFSANYNPESEHRWPQELWEKTTCSVLVIKA